jgi:hypothetical protein
MTMPTVKLNKHEYETIYRILITSSVESVGEQRNLNDILESFEKAGYALGTESSNGIPRMYTIDNDVHLELPGDARNTLCDHMDRGIGRFQTWSVRCIPDVLDRLDFVINTSENEYENKEVT